MRALQDCPQILAYRTGQALSEQLQGVVLFFLVQAGQASFLGDIECVRQTLLTGERLAPADGPYGEKDEHEDDIDQSDRRLEEVVVIPGDEFAQLVDKDSETYSAEHCRNYFGPVVQESQQYDQSNEHEKSAPQHMSDVQGADPELRKAGDVKVKTYSQYRGHCGHEEVFKHSLCVYTPHEYRRAGQESQDVV